MLRDLFAVLCGRISVKQVELLRQDRDFWYEQKEVAVRQRDDLTTTLLALDEEIYRMSQCSSWEAMRPIFNRIQAGAEERRRHVSKRIGEREIARIKQEAGPIHQVEGDKYV